jgi:hypothetical protein
LVGVIGKLSAEMSVESVMDIYVNSVTQSSMVQESITKFNVCLQCALKLMPYLEADSILLMHNFWIRHGIHHHAFDYYYVIGYARSVVALKRMPGFSEDVQNNTF